MKRKPTVILRAALLCAAALTFAACSNAGGEPPPVEDAASPFSFLEKDPQPIYFIYETDEMRDIADPAACAELISALRYHEWSESAQALSENGGRLSLLFASENDPASYNIIALYDDQSARLTLVSSETPRFFTAPEGVYADVAARLDASRGANASFDASALADELFGENLTVTYRPYPLDDGVTLPLSLDAETLASALDTASWGERLDTPDDWREAGRDMLTLDGLQGVTAAFYARADALAGETPRYFVTVSRGTYNHTFQINGEVYDAIRALYDEASEGE